MRSSSPGNGFENNYTEKYQFIFSDETAFNEKISFIGGRSVNYIFSSEKRPPFKHRNIWST